MVIFNKKYFLDNLKMYLLHINFREKNLLYIQNKNFFLLRRILFIKLIIEEILYKQIKFVFNWSIKLIRI